jgi:hypothetical protein
MAKARRAKPFLLLLEDQDQKVFTVAGPMTDDTEWGKRVSKAQAEGCRVNICGTEHRSIPLEQFIAETQQLLGERYRYVEEVLFNPMSDLIKFQCPQCHGETFKVTRKVKRLEDFNGATCAGCCRTITEDDVKHRAAEIARKLLTDALKR